MSEITDLVAGYADGKYPFDELRDDMRQVSARPRSGSESPWGKNDWLDVDKTADELAEACTIYDLLPDEYRMLAYDLAGVPTGQRQSRDLENVESLNPPDGQKSAVADDGQKPAEPKPAEPAGQPGAISVAKADRRRNLVFGWANVAMTPEGQVEDHQGHLIDVEDLEEAAYNFAVKYRVTGDSHMSEGFGELVESLVVTPDKIEKAGFPPEMLGHWWVGFRVPPEHWDSVVNGDRRMFSIQGRARLEPVESAET